MRKLASLCAALAASALLLAPPAVADPAVRDHDITVDDYATVATIIGCEISPDGKNVAYADLR